MTDRARALREEFDRSFAEPHTRDVVRGTPALAIRVGADGGHRWVLPLDSISSVTKRRKIAPLPGGPPSQIGLSGIHGQLTAVHSLGALLNYPGAPNTEAIQWLALVKAKDLSIALAFEALDGQILLSEQDLAAKVCLLPGEEAPRAIIDLDPLLQPIRNTSLAGGGRGGAKAAS